MSAGKVLVIDTPDGVVKGRHAATLEEAFIGYLEEAEAKKRAAEPAPTAQALPAEAGGTAKSGHGPTGTGSWFSLQRMLSCSYREFLELTRDPIRLTLAGVGSVILSLASGQNEGRSRVRVVNSHIETNWPGVNQTWCNGRMHHEEVECVRWMRSVRGWCLASVRRRRTDSTLIIAG
jgi:hypothetical protein